MKGQMIWRRRRKESKKEREKKDIKELEKWDFLFENGGRLSCKISGMKTLPFKKKSNVAVVII